MKNQEMTICLWYDSEAEEAVRFYTSVFENSEIGTITRYGKEGFEFHGKPEGTVMSIDFRLNGMNFIALNGGPLFKFNESVSIVVNCETQEEIDHYWYKLTEGGEESQCGWLKDRYGLSWQVVPANLQKFLTEGDPGQKSRVNEAMFRMQKFDIAELERVSSGAGVMSR